MFGKAVEEDDSLDELVGVLHLLDRFLAPVFGQRLEAPIFQQAIVQPVLVDGGQLVPQAAVEIFDDFGVALHGRVLSRVAGGRSPRGRPAIWNDCNVDARNAKRTRAKSRRPTQVARNAETKSVAVLAARAALAAGPQAPASASSMIRRMVRAHRPHCGAQPRQPYT